MPKDYQELNDKITRSIENTHQVDALQVATKRARDGRALALQMLGEEGNRLRQEVRSLKRDSVKNLPNLLREFTRNCERNGAHVFLAKDGKEAINYVMEIAKKNNAKLVAKSKSLTSEEIEFNHPFEEAGIQVVETDLGERIIQLAKEKPAHLVMPAVHKTQADVAELFATHLGRYVPDDIDGLMQVIREDLRPIFLSADIGVTGANVAVAETGSVVLETNEGNARLVTSIPRIHVVIVGMEKIVGTWEEAFKLTVAHPLSAGGQILTNYVSIITQKLPIVDGARGPTPFSLEERDSDFNLRETGREFHVVILDNGRLMMQRDPWFSEALSCIRCGACMNICPTYGVVGGHVFGYIYPGPIGIPWTRQVHGLDRVEDFVHLCISCGLCREICPADIDIPMMIAKVKEEEINRNGQLRINSILSDSERFAKIASATAPVSNWVLQSGLGKWLLERYIGIDGRRMLPRFERRTFKSQFNSNKDQSTTSSPPKRRVAYFVDLFANYNEPRIGMKAVQILQLLGAKVDVPKQKSSGMPYISYGELKKAKEIANFNVSSFISYVNKGYDIIATEPTAVYCLKYVYPKLLDFSQASREVSNHSFEFFEYLEKFFGDNYKSVLKTREEISQFQKIIGFHIPCHQRGLSNGIYTISFLESLGYKVRRVETGTCCGMAGTFGLKKGPLGYDLSMAVGNPLFQLFESQDDLDLIVTESSVCTMQLVDGTKQRVVHPFSLLREDLGK
jgi:L-lactate dehydrogenase complex protein LldF